MYFNCNHGSTKDSTNPRNSVKLKVSYNNDKFLIIQDRRRRSFFTKETHDLSECRRKDTKCIKCERRGHRCMHCSDQDVDANNGKLTNNSYKQITYKRLALMKSPLEELNS